MDVDLALEILEEEHRGPESLAGVVALRAWSKPVEGEHARLSVH